MLVKTAGVKHLVVLINKMDDPTVNWDEDRYVSFYCSSLFFVVVVVVGRGRRGLMFFFFIFIYFYFFFHSPTTGD